MVFKGLKNSKFVSLSFDECLNKVTQTNQIGIAVRYVLDSRSHIRYLTSQFLSHAKASDLEREIKCALEGIIDHHQLTMVSMDGPNVNLSLLGILKSERKEGGQPDLIDICICNHHVLHNNFKHGAEKNGWELNKIL